MQGQIEALRAERDENPLLLIRSDGVVYPTGYALDSELPTFKRLDPVGAPMEISDPISPLASDSGLAEPTEALAVEA